MKIIFTKQAKEKFKSLPAGSIKIKLADVLNAISAPNYKDSESDNPKIIVHGILDSTHIIRVVYKVEDGIITIITFYPTKKGRYEKKGWS